MEQKKRSNWDFIIDIVIIIWIVGAVIFSIYSWIEDNKKPTLEEYRKENYYITNGEEYVTEYCDSEQEEFTYQDVVDAYNAGLEDGIEQTIDYYTME